MRDVRTQVCNRMAALGWSMYRLAKQCNVAKATITKFLDGGKVRDDTLLKIALALEIQIVVG